MALRRKKEKEGREEIGKNLFWIQCIEKSEEKYIKSSQIKEKAGWSCFYKEKIKKNFFVFVSSEIRKRKEEQIYRDKLIRLKKLYIDSS